MVALAHMKKPKTANKKQSKSNEAVVFHTYADLRAALLIASLLGNLFVISLWLVARLTSDYDVALAQFFLNR